MSNCDQIYNPAMFEAQSCILFINAKNVLPIKIYRQINEVYDNGMTLSSLLRLMKSKLAYIKTICTFCILLSAKL